MYNTNEKLIAGKMMKKIGTFFNFTNKFWGAIQYEILVIVNS